MYLEQFIKFVKRQHEAIPFIFVVGFLFAVGFGGYYGWTRYVLSHSETTTGTVIDSWTTTRMTKNGSSSNTTYKYRFYVDGKDYTFNESESFPPQYVGETYPVYYDPANPSNATDGRRGGTLIVMCMGLLTMLITLIIALTSSPRDKSRG